MHRLFLMNEMSNLKGIQCSQLSRETMITSNTEVSFLMSICIRSHSHLLYGNQSGKRRRKRGGVDAHTKPKALVFMARRTLLLRMAFVE